MTTFDLTWKSVMAHKRRLLSTGIAIIVGVAFLCGTLVLGATMRSTFDQLFASVNSGVDVVVRGSGQSDDEVGARRSPIDANLAAAATEVNGVRTVAPMVVGVGQIVGADGQRIGGGGPPTHAATWIVDADINPYKVVDGREPVNANEVVIDRNAAKSGKLRVGSDVTVLTPAPFHGVISGLVDFVDDDASGGGSTYTGFTPDTARRLFAKPGTIDELRIAAKPGVSQSVLADRVRDALPSNLDVITGAQLTEENNKAIQDDFLGFFQRLLVVFAAIALLVAAFSIYNTFSILVAQRSRESALLRAIGASRRQVLTATLCEALLTGVVASSIGAVLGVGLAVGLLALLEALDVGLPSGSLVVSPLTAAICVFIGTAITLAAGVFPSLRASRVAPIAALRDVAIDRSSSSRWRAIVGVTLTGAGIVTAVLASGDKRVGIAAIGVTLTLLSAFVLGPIVSRPVTYALGAPLSWRSVVGGLSRRNAMRNPARTASTASALMVGIAVVTLFTIFAATLQSTIKDTARRAIAGDLALSSSNFSGAGIAPALVDAVARLPQVSSVAGIGHAGVLIDNKPAVVDYAEYDELDAVADIQVLDGSLNNLSGNQFGVQKKYADDNGWKLGRVVAVKYPDGSTAQLTLVATVDDNPLLANVLMPMDAVTAHAYQASYDVVFISLRDGVSNDAGKAVIAPAIAQFYPPKLMDKDEIVEATASGIQQFLTVVYALLVLAIVIALMGIANTLALSVHERRREIGLLRAVGQSRAQLRSMIRRESVVVALYGAVCGAVLGSFAAWILVRSLSTADALDFTVPAEQVGIIVAIGAATGIIAAIRPARRAARADILAAINAE